MSNAGVPSFLADMSTTLTMILKISINFSRPPLKTLESNSEKHGRVHGIINP